MEHRSPSNTPRRSSARWCQLASLIGAALLLFGTATAQNVTVSGGSTGDGGHATLAAAISAIGTTGNAGIDVVVTINANLTAGATINEGDWNTLTIVPNGARTITQLLGAAPIIDLDGADRVTIDGLNTGGNSLSISNTSTATTANTSTIRFINDASGNTITNCTILGASAGVLATFNGNILFGAGTTTGNDNNLISNCDIGSATVMSKAIVSDGSTSSLAIHNSGNTIDNCNIYNYFLAAAARGVQLRSGNHQWTITNNRFYQTASRTHAALGTHYVVEVASGSNALAGGHTIEYNTFGYANAAGTGTYALANSTNLFRGISLDVANTAPRNSISYNVFASMSLLSSNSGTGAGSPRTLIYVNSGEADVNNNQFGSQDATGNIVMQVNGGGHIHGILNVGGTNLVTNDNTAGGITVQTSTSSNELRFFALRNLANTTWESKRNIIGSYSVTNSIQTGTGTGSRTLAGILAEAGTLSADSNEVVNVAITGTGTSGRALSGIEMAGAGQLSANYNVIASLSVSGTATNTNVGTWVNGIRSLDGAAVTAMGNTIRDLNPSVGTISTGSGSAIVGINVSAGANNVQIDSNTVHSLVNENVSTGTSSRARHAVGIHLTGTGTNTVTRNAVYSLRPTSSNTSTTTSNASSATGILIAGGTANRVANNMVRLGVMNDGSSVTMPYSYAGIQVNGTGTFATIVHNSVYIGGSDVLGTATPQTTHALLSATTVNDPLSRVYKNNILYNGRGNATAGAAHYAIGVANSNLGNLDSDHNILYAPGTGGVVGQLGAAATSFGDWRTVAPIKDGNSFEADPRYQFPEGAVNLATPRLFGLHINAAIPTVVEGLGIDVGETEDYDGQPRAGLTPVDIGADAGNFTAVPQCGSAPDGGAVSPGLVNVCPAGTVDLSNDADNSMVLGVVYQWEQSADGVGGWTDATGAGATSLTYSADFNATTMYYRLKATCTNTNDEAFSNVAQVDPALVYHMFDGISFSESFEGPWLDQCGTTVPGVHWNNSPILAAQSAWRRSDVFSGNCNGSTGGPSQATDGNFSARFRSSYSPTLASSLAVAANLDLYIDMSAAPGPSVLRFDHFNEVGPDFLQVFLSTDGGSSFTQVGSDITAAPGWNEYSFPINSTSPTTVIRLRSSDGICGNPDDLLVDNFRLDGPCTGTPPQGTITGAPPALCDNQTATLSYDPGITTGGITWQWQQSTDNFNADIQDVGTLDSPTYDTGVLTGTMYYRVVITCSPSSGQNISAVTTINWGPVIPAVTASPATQNVCAGSPAQLTAGGANTYIWSPATYLDSPTGTVVNASIPFLGTSVFTVVGTALSGCTAAATASVTVVAAPFGVVISPATPAPFCAGGNVDLGAISGVAASTTIYNTASTGTNEYLPFSRVSYPTRRVTYIFAKSLLGIPAGSTLTSLSFHVVNTEGVTVNGFTLRVGNTSSGAGTQVAPTTVWGPEDHTLVTGLNTFQFSTPVVMDGTANIAVDVSYTVTPGSPNPTMNVNSGSTTVAYSFTGAGSSTGSTSAAYPRMTFEYSTADSPLPTFAWTPTTGLTPGTGIGANVNAAPGSTQVYTATASFNGCSATSSVTVTIDPLPIATAGGSETICYLGATSSVSGTATNGTPFWTHNGTGSLANANTLTPTYTAGAGDLPGTSVTLTLRVTSNNTCNPQFAEATYTVDIYELSVLLGLGSFTCGSPINPDVVFTFTGTPPYTFTYTFNGGSPQTVNGHNSNTYTLPAASAGIYQVTALADGTGCPATNLGNSLLAGPYNNDLFFVYSVGNNYQDVTWSLFQSGTNNLVQTGQPFFNGNGSVPTCLPDGNFYLRVTDAGGDGIAGGYRLITQDGRRIIDNTENFNSGGVSAIANNGGFNLPLGMDRPIFTSCDKMWWKTGEFLVATENPAVSAVWVNGPNSAQSPTSGYEFWWYNPNGGYSFRRFRAHTESDGYANVGATRACHVRLNNWATANHLPEGVFLNVKVRGRVNGVNQNWGEACRFTLDNALGNCPPTKLMDIPGHPQYSCGEIRSLERGQRVYARPMRGATHYQWRFRVPAEEPALGAVVVTTNAYILNLNTVALVYGKTYEVEVRASKDGTTTWCGTGNQNPAVLSPKWGDVCLLTIAPPMTGPEVEGILRQAQDGGLRMWPNPNRGDQLWINLEGIAAGVETVTVDLYDLSGKRIVARVLPTQGEHLNTVVALNGDLAGGMYLVHVTAGERTYIERLVVQP